VTAAAAAVAKLCAHLPKGENLPPNIGMLVRHMADNVSRTGLESNCPICWEEQRFVVRNRRARDIAYTSAMASGSGGGGEESADGSASSGSNLLLMSASARRSKAVMAQLAVANKVREFHDVIFGYEHNLRGDRGDDYIFQMMLMLRENIVESHLARAGIAFERWTLGMLRDHYGTELGSKAHVYYEERILKQDLDASGKIQDQLRGVGYVHLDPKTGLPSTRIVDTWCKVQQRRQAIAGRLTDLKEWRTGTPQAASISSQLVLAVREASQRGRFQTVKALRITATTTTTTTTTAATTAATTKSSASGEDGDGDEEDEEEEEEEEDEDEDDDDEMEEEVEEDENSFSRRPLAPTVATHAQQRSHQFFAISHVT
jgi:hypothetical protein